MSRSAEAGSTAAQSASQDANRQTGKRFAFQHQADRIARRVVILDKKDHRTLDL